MPEPGPSYLWSLCFNCSYHSRYVFISSGRSTWMLKKFKDFLPQELSKEGETKKSKKNATERLRSQQQKIRRGITQTKTSLESWVTDAFPKKHLDPSPSKLEVVN